MKRAALALALAACSAAPAEPAGVGAWDVTRTKRKDATGRCEPTDLGGGRKGTWCYLQPPIKLGAQAAAVDLYFAGDAPDAPLIEEQLKIATCDPDQVEAWARTSFGAPYQGGHGGFAFWKNRYVWIALVPIGTQCEVRILPLGETDDIARITASVVGGGK